MPTRVDPRSSNRKDQVVGEICQPGCVIERF